ncbi:flagellar biosynthetic protein FliR [Solimonas sp. SE-A11]|uniref:flagellar biosynthetic protein FliR n=1 Tax=Solimonas sp. SE-A11 TaxID=3054954 RepID=UPI00259C9000|nr:flagellar biosynthetic protein FliR [Solimonas sp. SE-A11]MDM4772901.1 flagellar biosynthetic protein FliR [Solimonas sp. SE-A11]
MNLVVQAEWIVMLLMAAARIAGALAFAPVLGFATLPTNIRLFLILALALMTAGLAAGGALPAAPQTLMGLILAMGREVLLGALLGFGILAAFGALAVGGRLLDYQMGFGIATLFDPSTRGHGSLMGAVFTMLGATIFLALDAHHTLIRGFAFSFQSVPAGSPLVLPIQLVMGQFGLMFVYGFILVAPVVFALILMDLVIGFAARVMPQVNAYFVALPAKAFVGLLVTAISLRFSGGIVQSLFEKIFLYWQQVLVAR